METKRRFFSTILSDTLKIEAYTANELTDYHSGTLSQLQCETAPL